MNIIYFDCFNGAAGDMLLAALLDAGLELCALEEVLAKLPLEGYRIEHLRASSHGITGSRVKIHINETQPSRDWQAIRMMLEQSDLPERTCGWAIGAFHRLARAEGRIHGVDEEHVHFHEVGAVDSIIDTVGVCAALELLGVEAVYASPLPTGSGWVRSAHGPIPVPAPATLALLAEVAAPLLPTPVRGELVTPTAAALLAELATFEQPPMRVARVGYGLGTKEFERVNGLRVWLGTGDNGLGTRNWGTGGRSPHPQSPVPDPQIQNPKSKIQNPKSKIPETEPSSIVGRLSSETVTELRCNLDDATGEVVAYALERALAAGALDAWAVPLTMKKGRPGVQLCCLARPADVAGLAALLLRETPTLGVRWEQMERLAAGRDHVSVETPWGAVRVKRKLLDGVVAGAAPEYEECAALARAHGVPLQAVYAAALAALAPHRHAGHEGT